MIVKPAAGALLFVTLGLLGGPAVAQPAIPADCLPVVGTYLTANTLPNGQDGTIHSQSLLTLTSDGLAFRTDSDENGGIDNSGFTNSQGVWACEGVNDGKIALSATLLNFSYGAGGGQEGSTARLTYSGSYVPAETSLELEAKLLFFMPNDDPNVAKPEGDPIPVRVTGYKVQNIK